MKAQLGGTGINPQILRPASGASPQPPPDPQTLGRQKQSTLLLGNHWVIVFLFPPWLPSPQEGWICRLLEGLPVMKVVSGLKKAGKLNVL